MAIFNCYVSSPEGTQMFYSLSGGFASGSKASKTNSGNPGVHVKRSTIPQGDWNAAAVPVVPLVLQVEGTFVSWG